MLLLKKKSRLYNRTVHFLHHIRISYIRYVFVFISLITLPLSLFNYSIIIQFITLCDPHIESSNQEEKLLKTETYPSNVGEITRCCVLLNHYGNRQFIQTIIFSSAFYEIINNEYTIFIKISIGQRVIVRLRSLFYDSSRFHFQSRHRDVMRFQIVYYILH